MPPADPAEPTDATGSAPASSQHQEGAAYGAAGEGRGKVVVAGWSGTENLGDELLLRALLRRLAAHDLGAVVVSRDPAATTRLHGVPALGLADAVGLGRALRASQGVVLGPGGIIQDETSPFSLPWHLARVPQARLARRPLVGVGLGVGPLTRRGSLRLTGWALRHAGAVAVRDEASADLLRRAGVRRVEAGCDLVLGFGATQVEPLDRIVVCLRPHRPGGHTVPLQHLPASELDPQRVRSVAAGLDALAAVTGLPLHLVALEAGRDDRYHDLVAQHLRAPVTTAVPRIDDVLTEVAASRLVVAMRFHAGIAAVLGGRPAVLLGYATKVRSLATSLGPAAQLLADDPAGYASLPEAGSAVIGRDEHMAESRERLSRGLTAHDRALAALVR